MKCPECGERNAADALQCAKCGEVLLDPLGQTGASSTVRPTPTEVPSPTEASPEIQTEIILPGEAETHATPSPVGTGDPRTAPGQTTGSRQLALHSVFGGRYEILELIGEGGMGQVYKARDGELGKVIALKTIRVDKEDPETLQRFKQELLLARKITHKNVIRIHDMGEAEGVKFITMEYIEGQSLKRVIRKRGKLPVDQALVLAKQILGALEEAHGQHVIHRDLKPQNIMVDEAGVVYVMDFGIARSADTTGLTATGAVVGTPDYMSPEQVRGEKTLPASDLFAFGVILYEMVTGDLPYKGETPMSKVMMRLTHKPRPPRELNVSIPKYLERVVLKCMEVDQELRYQSARQILEDLERGHVTSSMTLRVQRAVKRRMTPIAAAALVGVVALGAYLVASRPPPVEEEVVEGPTVSLAILPFTNATGSESLDWMRTGLPEMLVTDMGQSRFVRPVAGERVYKVLDELGLGQQTRFDEAALESVSQRTPAESVLYGQYVESEGQLRIDMTLRKAGSGVPIPLKVEAATADVFSLVDQITAQIKAQLDLTPEQLRGDTDRPVVEVSTASLEGLQSYQAGLAALRQGENQAAVPLLKEATGHDPDFAMAYAKLAEAYLETGADPEARAAIERAQALSERKPLPLAERYQIHATAALVEEDFEKAVVSLTELAALYPKDPDIALNLARTCEMLGRLPDAGEAYQKVLDVAPDYVAALLGLGRVRVMTGQHQEAIRSLQAALDTGQLEGDLESLGMVYSIMGVAHREIGELDEAVVHLERSLDFRLQADDKRGQAMTLGNLAQIYDAQGDMDKSLQSMRKALALLREIGDRGGESQTLSDIALTYKTTGQLDRALATFRESLDIEMERQDHASMANRLDNIADVYRLMGRYGDAIVYLEQAKSHLAETEEKREKAVNYNHFGTVRKAQGLYQEALEAFLAALPLLQEIQDRIGTAIVQQHVAEIYEHQGRYGDAYGALKQSLETAEDLDAGHHVAEMRIPLGRLLVAVGRPDEAEEQLKEAHHVGHESHADALTPAILLAQAELTAFREGRAAAAKTYEEANVQANLSGQKEVAVKSRIELGRLYLEEGKLPNARRLLERTRREAATARLRPLEAEAAAALADVHLARGDAEAARKAAIEAIDIADNFSGRPTLSQAYIALGEALARLGRPEEATDAYAKAADTVDWIRGSLLPEHASSYMSRPDIQRILHEAVSALETGDRAAEAAPLKKWLEPSAATTTD